MPLLDEALWIDPPNQLKFKGPFNVPVTAYMRLTSVSDKKLLFKIKTTAPKKYCVRPNSGVLNPKSNIEIAICLQPFIFDPAEKNKHKFMVQAIYVPEGETNLDALWKNIDPDELMDSKLKCVFEPEDGASSPPQQNDVDADEKPKHEVKASPKVDAGHTPSQADTELQKAAREAKTQHDEDNLVRQENLMLKEEIIRLRHMGTTSSAPLAVNTKYNPAVQAPTVPMAYIVAAVAAVVFGILVGKFIL